MLYDNIVLGATFYGCGMAYALPGKTLLLESTPLVGSDFALTFNGGRKWDTPLATDGARDLLDMLQKHKAISSDDVASIPALSTLLAKWCLERSLNINLSCSVVRYDSVFVEAVDVSGNVSFNGKRVIDARSYPIDGNKWLTALISAPSSMPPGGKGPFVLRKSFVPGEYLLSFQVPEDATWSEARAIFHRAWDMRPLALKYSSILLVGTKFDFRNYDNPALALEAGLMAGRA